MSLSDDDKKRILEEEKARVAAREQAEQEAKSKKSQKRMRNFLIGLAIVGGCVYMVGKSPDNKGAQPGSVQQASEAPIKVPADRLIAAYKSNEVAADNQYKGKLVETVGIVGDVKKDILDQIYVTLGTGAQFELPTVQCFFSDEYASKAAALKKGQRLTIRGRVDGLMGNVLVKDSEF
jgi:hypothetical protein